jgi:hypothetical protein
LTAVIIFNEFNQLTLLGVFALGFDQSGSRLLTCEADKTIKNIIYKKDDYNSYIKFKRQIINHDVIYIFLKSFLFII